jgi:hypothetical protein
MSSPDLWERVAEHLGGEGVRVYAMAPRGDGLEGVAARSPDGSLYIAISAELRGAKRLQRFLHEVAHIRLGDVGLGPGLPALSTATRAVWSERIATGDGIDPIKEDCAEDLAAGWILEARRRAGEGASTRELLQALLQER